MQSLQQLGVTKPGHIADLLVTDLEEAVVKHMLGNNAFDFLFAGRSSMILCRTAIVWFCCRFPPVARQACRVFKFASFNELLPERQPPPVPR